ncbi:methionyl-trna formyltransferase [Stemphylium lycopersici]|uniref:methionyl-tRNA formyltransferase n=1 Tax=Stemphylium lycopersici TaxID=183478 RepID=A0A364MZK2_STELY|nr:methionyl-trna formyltransferase [Stemphylium lycopersici]RAR07821.1 methionyl-trna formyltransferase [Stemphylium lycopersici]
MPHEITIVASRSQMARHLTPTVLNSGTMLWRLPGSVRSLLVAPQRQYSALNKSPATSGPLRILFCGSDHFSITSLRALVDAKRHVPRLIDSIHVLHRPAKPTGRGLKTLREVPIQRVATEELDLPTHTTDTFTGWSPPAPIDLVIAVSFGLLVPPRILAYAQYGGLNVHPSLLPDFRGPAPIEHAILKRRKHTGVSVQTLHPEHFDHGTILAQTPAPGIPIPSWNTPQELEKQLAEKGAEMLVDVLKSRRFVPPLQDAGWYAKSNNPIDHAPKITKRDSFIDFEKDTLEDIFAKQNALGDPWCILPDGSRLILHEVYDFGMTYSSGLGPGFFNLQDVTAPVFRAACGRVGTVVESTYEGVLGLELSQILPSCKRGLGNPNDSEEDAEGTIFEKEPIKHTEIRVKGIKAMGLAAGGKLGAFTHPVVLLSPTKTQGTRHPPLVHVEEYTQVGGQFFVVEEKVDDRLDGGDFDNVKSVSRMDKHIG